MKSEAWEGNNGIGMRKKVKKQLTNKARVVITIIVSWYAVGHCEGSGYKARI